MDYIHSVKLVVANIQDQLKDDLSYQYSIENNDIANMMIILKAYDLPHSLKAANRQLKYHDSDVYLAFKEGIANDDLPLNIVWERPYNVPVDWSINDEIFQANAEIQKHVSKILTDEA